MYRNSSIFLIYTHFPQREKTSCHDSLYKQVSSTRQEYYKEEKFLYTLVCLGETRKGLSKQPFSGCIIEAE